ncbi:MAG: YceH family protein [Elusimicrobia bacterium]|nr:YceH family protein [Elusimicrobiota bacterium]MDE2509603.1 YceH family protein [Elusimicrobiota bacterium]
MTMHLDDIEARVLGSLVEKSLTTPEQYPLSMNALVNACNQRTSREPVMNLDEAAVGRGLHSLLEKSLAGRLHEPGARVPKFMHHIEMLLTGADAKAIAAICVLLLRGPQTPGEIKTRTDRLCEFASTAEVETLLQEMLLREDPWVAKLPRQPGQKEQRYRHVFSGETAPSDSPPSASSAAVAAPTPAAPDRLAELEKRVEALEALVRNLTAKPPEAA